MLGSDGPVLDSDRVAVGQGMRPRHDVAGAEDVGVADGRQRRVAFEPGIQCKPLPASHSVFGSAPSPTTTRSAATREPSVNSTASTRAAPCSAATPSRGADRRRGRGAARRTIRPAPGPAAASASAAMSISVTSRPCLRAVWATSHPMNPAPTIATRGRLLERGSQRDRVVEVAQDVDALQLAAGARPASRPGPGRQDQPVVRDLVAVGEHHPPPRAVQARRRHAQAPLRVERVRREVDALDLVLTGEHAPSTAAAACTAGGAPRPPSPDLRRTLRLAQPAPRAARRAMPRR